MAGTIRQFVRRIPAAIKYVASGLSFQAWLRGDEPASGGITVTQPMAQSVWVYRCIRDISDTLSGVAVRLSRPQGKSKTRAAGVAATKMAAIVGRRDAGDVEIEAGEAWALTRMPGAEQTAAAFFRETIMFLEHDGNVFWILRDQVGRRPQRIEIAPMSEMRPVQARGGVGPVIGWVRMYPWGEQEPFDIDDVVQVRFDSPYSRIWGLSPIDCYRLGMQADVSAATWNKVAFDNNAEPGVVLRYPGSVQPEQFKQIRESWNSRHRGPGKARGTAVLDSGGEASSFASTHNEMQYIEGRKFSREEAAAAFGVPLERLSGLQDSNRSTGQVGERSYWMQTLIPLGRLVAEAWTMRVLRRFDLTAEAWFDFASVPALQEMYRENIEAGCRLIEKGATFEQVNEAFDWGFEVNDAQRETWVSGGMVPARFILEEQTMPGSSPAGTGPALPEGQPEEPATPDGGEEPQRTRAHAVGGTETRGRGEIEAHAAKSEKEADRRKRVWTAWVRSWRPLERSAQRSFAKFFRRQESEMVRRLTQSASRGQGEGIVDQGKGPDEAPRIPGTIIGQVLLDVTEENARLRVVAHRWIREGLVLGIDQVLDEVDPPDGNRPADIRVRILNEPLTREISRRLAAKLVDVNRATMARSRAALTEGINNGETLAELRQRLHAVFEQTPVRSLRIARTETAASVSAGRQRAFEDCGIDGKVWLDSHDEFVRDEHRQAGRDYAEPIPVDRPFMVGGEALMYPGDPNGSAGNVINCRCCHIAKRLRGGRSYDGYAFVSWRSGGRGDAETRGRGDDGIDSDGAM